MDFLFGNFKKKNSGSSKKKQNLEANCCEIVSKLDVIDDVARYRRKDEGYNTEFVSCNSSSSEDDFMWMDAKTLHLKMLRMGVKFIPTSHMNPREEYVTILYRKCLSLFTTEGYPGLPPLEISKSSQKKDLSGSRRSFGSSSTVTSTSTYSPTRTSSPSLFFSKSLTPSLSELTTEYHFSAANTSYPSRSVDTVTPSKSTSFRGSILSMCLPFKIRQSSSNSKSKNSEFRRHYKSIRSSLPKTKVTDIDYIINNYVDLMNKERMNKPYCAYCVELGESKTLHMFKDIHDRVICHLAIKQGCTHCRDVLGNVHLPSECPLFFGRWK